MYGVFNVGMFTFISEVGYLFQFQVMKLFPMSQFYSFSLAIYLV